MWHSYIGIVWRNIKNMIKVNKFYFPFFKLYEIQMFNNSHIGMKATFLQHVQAYLFSKSNRVLQPKFNYDTLQHKQYF